MKGFCSATTLYDVTYKTEVQMYQHLIQSLPSGIVTLQKISLPYIRYSIFEIGILDGYLLYLGTYYVKFLFVMQTAFKLRIKTDDALDQDHGL